MCYIIIGITCASSISHFHTSHNCCAVPVFKCLSSSVWFPALLTSMLPHWINPLGCKPSKKIRMVHFWTLHVHGIMTHTVISCNKSLDEGINHPQNDFIATIVTPTWLSLAFPRDPSPFQVMSKEAEGNSARCLQTDTIKHSQQDNTRMCPLIAWRSD